MSADMPHCATPIAADLPQSVTIAVYPAYTAHSRSLKPHNSHRIRSRVSAQSVRVAIHPKIDRVLARHYGFTTTQLDFILNYDIKYRMGKDADTGESEEE